jgi:hypothetical protein
MVPYLMLPIIKRAARILGDGKTPNYTALAKAIGCHRSSLYGWRRVPIKYIPAIVRVTDGKITIRQLCSK